MQSLKPKWFVLRVSVWVLLLPYQKDISRRKKPYFQQVGMKVSKPVLLAVYNVFFFSLH